MTMFHGTLFYAVRSRDKGAFGGVAKSATIKIYRSNNAAVPACVLDAHGQMTEFEGLIAECGDDRAFLVDKHAIACFCARSRSKPAVEAVAVEFIT